MNHESTGNTNTNTADQTGADTNVNGNENAGKKKTTFRKFGGYALKGAVVAAVGTGLYFGIRALMGNAGEAVVDAVDGAVAAV